MAPRLPNYLRTYRRRIGLSQDEMAFLLGTTSGTRVSRYERFGREPGLPTALAYQIVFRIPQEDLFAGLFERIEAGVRTRAGKLVERLEAASAGPGDRHKLAALRAVARKKT